MKKDCKHFECAYYKVLHGQHFCRATYTVIYGGSCTNCRKNCGMCRFWNETTRKCVYEPFSEKNDWKEWWNESARRFKEMREKYRHNDVMK